MTDNITIVGFVATPPRHLVTSEGLPITSFRLASTQRRYDRTKESWVDGETNWYTVTAFRQLAMNTSASIRKGDRVITTGRLRIRDWTSADKTGTNVEVDADSIGHDLGWGTAAFTRNIVTTGGAASVADATSGDPALRALTDPALTDPATEAQPDDDASASDERGDSASGAESDRAGESSSEGWASSLPVPF